MSQSQLTPPTPLPLRLFNTLSRQVEDFIPLVPGKVGLYTCGPTVYSYAHIGNLRSYIFADTLRRTLEAFGYEVRHVMNITDVGHLTDDGDCGEDKLEVGARREGLDAWAVARKYTEAFFTDAAKLGICRPHVICKATDYIPEQIAMIVALEAKGYAYRTDDGVYFETKKFPAYPDLARLDVAGLQEGFRVEAGAKHCKTDFALWKLSRPDENRQMEWDSPWGRGFPGWHIECSAMAMKFLGEQFDIHTGGVDHIPIHHSNEIAQSECATGRSPFVRYWMHGEFLVVDEAEKMSKSLGNVLTVATLEANGFSPLAYRALILQSHYRKQLKFSHDNLLGAARGFERLTAMARKLKAEAANVGFVGQLSDRGQTHQRAFIEALANDLNTPQAFANLFAVIEDQSVSAAERYHLVTGMDAVFGLALFDEPVAAAEAPPELLAMLVARNQARSDKNWGEADRLRKAIIDAGYEILDSPEGSALKRRL